MNILQRIVLIAGTTLTIYFLAFSTYTVDVVIENPKYSPSNTRWTAPKFITETKEDYKKKFTYAGASALGTAVLFFALQSTKKEGTEARR